MRQQYEAQSEHHCMPLSSETPSNCRIETSLSQVSEIFPQRLHSVRTSHSRPRPFPLHDPNHHV
jgi:hypothetical protein